MESQEPRLWAFLGLGNPLPEYSRTRHNVGHWVVDELAKRRNLRMRRRDNAAVATTSLNCVRLVLAKSLTYMNDSGSAAHRLVARLGIPPCRLLVICDDMNLPLGRLRLRRSGSDGGHKGLGSVIQAMGTCELPRLRVGVGVLPPGEDGVSFVLGTFREDEQEAVAETVGRAADCLESAVLEGIEAAMSIYNRAPSPNQRGTNSWV